MEPRKKILIVTDYFYPHWTGISKSLYYLVRSLENTYDSTILTVAFQKGLPKEEKLFNAKIIREPFLFSISRAKYSVSLVLKAVSQVRATDVVFINSPCTNIFPIAILAKLFGKKLIIFHQGDLLLPKGFQNRVLEKIFDVFSLTAAKLADQLATYTIDYAKYSRILYPFLEKTSAVLLPIYLEDPDNSFPEVEILKSLKSKKKIIFGFAGRFVEEKGFDLLLRAIPEIMKELPNAHFVFAGETHMGYEHFFEKNKKQLELVRQNLTMLGLLNSSRLASFYSFLDFLIIPSRSDCFNLVQAEAMLFGVPVIVSNIPGARFLVQKTGFGKIFESEDEKSLAKAAIQAVLEKDAIKQNQKKVKVILDNAVILESFKKFVEK